MPPQPTPVVTGAPEDRTTLAEVEARLRTYHQVGFAEVLEAIAYLRDDGDTVLCGGSLTLGLGNALSDLDVVVSGSAGTESSRLPLQHWVSSVRVDVWKLHDDILSELFERAEDALGAPGPIDGIFGDNFEEADLKLLHRVAFGILVDGDELRPPASRPYRAIAADLLVREYAERARAAAFVASLAVSAGAWIDAASHARLAVHSALHATVYARGVAFTGDKWLRERIGARAPALVELHDTFAVLPDGPEAAADFTGTAVAAVERLSGLDLSTAALTGQLTVDTGDLRLHTAGPRRFLLSPTLDGLWELSEDEADTWQRVATGNRLVPTADDSAGWTLAYRLVALGIAQVHWTAGLPVPSLAFDRVELS